MVFLLFALVILFILYPMAAVIVKSVDGPNGFTLDMFRQLLTEDGRLIRNSLKVGLLTTLLSTIFSIVIAWTAWMSPKAIQRGIQAVLLFTMISPPFVTSIAYILMFGRRGLITHGLLGLTLNTYGFVGIVSMQTLGFLSLNALLLIGMLSSIDSDMIRAARDLGASTKRILLEMVLPNMRASIMVIVLLTFVRSLSDFSTPAIIGGAYEVLATESYLQVIAYNNLERASAMNVLLFLPSIFAYLVYRREMKGKAVLHTSKISSVEAPVLNRRGFYWLLLTVTSCFLFLIVAQYASIFWAAFTKVQQGAYHFTLAHFKEASIYLDRTLVRSIVYSLISGFFGTLMGFLIAYYLDIRKVRLMKITDAVATMPYVIPGTFFGLGYLFAFRSEPLRLTGTALIVILNVLFKQIPFSTKVGQSTLQGVDPNMIDASKDLGAHPLGTLLRVIFPVSKKGLFVSFINNFSATMTTVGSIIFLVYPGQKLVTLVMFDVLQTGKTRVGAVLAVVLMSVIFVVNIGMLLLLNGGFRNAGSKKSHENL